MAQYKAVGVAGARGQFMQGMGDAIAEYDVVTPTAALALNDTLDLIRVARGTELHELFKFSGDFDTGATLQYSLGYRPVDAVKGPTANTTYFAAAGQTDLQAAVLGSAPTRYAFSPITFDEDVFITMTVTAAAAGVSGTPSITTFTRGKARGGK